MLALMTGCTSKTTTPVKTTVPDVEVNFSGDSAYKYVAEQVAFGPRVPGSEAHGRCLEYLVKTLERMGAEVEINEGEATGYDSNMWPVKNIIARINPKKANRVIVCSHWDSRPFADHDEDASYHNKPIDGANDGASGVGVIIEMARQMQIKAPTIGVDLILFDTEDCGTPDHIKVKKYVADSWCLGSQVWGKTTKSEARYGILLDMVGAEGAMFYQEMFSKQVGQNIVDKVWNTAKHIGYGNHFVYDEGGYITDDHYYVSKLTGVPCIDIIQYEPHSGSSFYKHWHTHNDTMEHISRETLEAVGRVVLTVIYNER